ncbi:MAG: AAA family ATPase [Firmicutes bacterium]|nr:AAA family ATPase [Bacillota bacterium]
MSALIMIQGTSASAGKTFLSAALCRLLAEEGYKVAPFCVQSGREMVPLPGGGEIGWSQYMQAEAAGSTAVSEMNPLLLKTISDTAYEVVFCGKNMGEMTLKEYRSFLSTAFNEICAALTVLRQNYDVVVVEGVNTPVELHQPELDLANMRLAAEINAPVLLVTDIDRGGMFAYVVGTQALLQQHQQQLIKGVVVNRFRGFKDKLQGGLTMLEELIKKPIIGVLPYLNNISLQPPLVMSAENQKNRQQAYVLLSQALRENLDIKFILELIQQKK